MTSVALPTAWPQVAERALDDAEFTTPPLGTCSVVVFDSTRWIACEADAAQCLGPQEHERAARFRFARDRSRYVLAHALWRRVIARCLGCTSVAVPLASSPSGQPCLPATGWSTSLSYGGDWVAIAVACACTVGIDLEQSPTLRRLSGLATSICTAEEALDLQTLTPDALEQALLVLWTRKEALLKAFGTGLQVPPASFAATPGVWVVPPPATGMPPCRVLDLLLPAGLSGALALPAQVSRYKVHRLDDARCSVGDIPGLGLSGPSLGG